MKRQSVAHVSKLELPFDAEGGSSLAHSMMVLHMLDKRLHLQHPDLDSDLSNCVGYSQLWQILHEVLVCPSQGKQMAMLYPINRIGPAQAKPCLNAVCTVGLLRHRFTGKPNGLSRWSSTPSAEHGAR